MIALNIASYAKPVSIAPGRRHDPISRLGRLAAFYLAGRKVRLRNQRPMVSFTFDDIPHSAYANGAAILDEHGLRGTFYVSGGLCGASHAGWRFASKDALADIARRGHEIGCHTYAHKDIQTLSAGEIEAELRKNERFIGALGAGARAVNFAYPYGSVGLLQKPLVQKHFASCRGVRAGINAGSTDLGHLRAVPLYDSTITLAQVEQLIEQTERQRGWLIFYTHDVYDPPSGQGTSSQLFRAAIVAAARSSCDVVTVREALEQAGVIDARGRTRGEVLLEARQATRRAWFKAFWASVLIGLGGFLVLDAV